MNLHFKCLSSLVLGLLFSSSAALGETLDSGATDIVAVPPMLQVSDLTGTLTAADQAGLETKVQALEKAKGAQLAVLIVPTTGDEDIEQYAHRVFESWHLGRKGIDDGVLLIIAKKDKHLRIEVGRGLEGAIPDISAKRIGSDVIAPLWKKGDTSAALNAGVDALAKLITQEALPATPKPASAPSDDAVWILVLVLIVGGIGVVCFINRRDREPESDSTKMRADADRSDYFNPSSSAAAALATNAVLNSKTQSSIRRRDAEDDSSSQRSSRRDADDSSSSSGSSESSSSSESWSGGGGESAGGGASSDL
jgi:uncharacterized membrane protein YgcG